MPDPRTEDPFEHIREVARDLGNVDFRPHDGDKIRHRSGAVTTFSGEVESVEGVHIIARTLLPSPITRIQIEGTIQL